MFGTVLNAAGILLGGLAGLTVRDQFSPQTQSLVRMGLGVFTVWIGLQVTWMSLHGPFWNVLKELLLLVLALTLGRLLGRLLRIQKGMNSLGQYAKEQLAQARPGSPQPFSHGFLTATVLFCAAPLAIVGSVQDGLNHEYRPLLVKAIMDGLATMAFVKAFGWSPMLAVFPVAAYQLTLTGIATWLLPALYSRGLLDSVNAVGGMLIFCVALIVLELKKIELGDYLPALVVAPLLAWIWR